MAKILSVITISYLGWKLTGYDFFILTSLITYAIDIHDYLLKLQKRLFKNTKDKTA